MCDYFSNQSQQSRGYMRRNVYLNDIPRGGIAVYLLNGLWNAAQHVSKNVGLDLWQRLSCACKVA